MEERNEDTFKLKKSTLWKVGTVVFGLLFLVTIFHDVTESGTSVNGNAIRVDPTEPTIPTGVVAVRADDFVDDDPVLGNKNAPLTIVEFSDFQCPFCRRFWKETLPQIEKDYIDTGKVQFAYRHFPLTAIHPAAVPAAQASECANEQGRFWQMHDKIFDEQEKLSAGGTAQFEASDLKKWASDLGLNTTQFNQCLDSGKFTKNVTDDEQEAQKLGINGTPTIFVNGLSLVGAQPYDSFKSLIDKELSK